MSGLPVWDSLERLEAFEREDRMVHRLSALAGPIAFAAVGIISIVSVIALF